MSRPPRRGDDREASGAARRSKEGQNVPNLAYLSSKCVCPRCVENEAEIRGTIKSIDVVAASFVVTTSGGPVTVQTDAKTRFRGPHDAVAGFSDLHTGQSVEVDGTRRADGSILAREVQIED